MTDYEELKTRAHKFADIEDSGGCLDLQFQSAAPILRELADAITALQAERDEYRKIGKNLADINEKLAADFERNRARVAELEATQQWAYETLTDLDVNKYDHDDVCDLNYRSVEVMLELRKKPLEGEQQIDATPLRVVPSRAADPTRTD